MEGPTLVTGKPRALLLVGQNPGYNEDVAGRCWIGWTGNLLHRWLTEVYHLDDLCDIYLTNAVRCATPPNRDPSNSQIRLCRPHLHADISTLQSRYGPNLIIMALGAHASVSLTNKKLKQNLVYQGALRVPYGSTLPAVPIFFTYHPSICCPGRAPVKVRDIDLHFKLLLSHLKEESTSAGLPPIEEAPALLSPPPASPLALDIETYGILDGRDQTVFHPARSDAIDHADIGSQIVCVALSWRDPSHTLHLAWYDFTNPTHRRRFHTALATTPPGTCILGMNLAFDITYLRLNHPELRLLLRSPRFTWMDLSILNHLHSDTRPERSLKELSQLFGTADYQSLRVSTLPTGHKATSPSDPNLRHYNCTDAHSTLLLAEQLLAVVGPRISDSVAGYSIPDFVSGLLDVIIHMTEHGLVFSLPLLRKLHSTTLAAATDALSRGASAGYTFGGPGSEKSLRTLFHRLFTDCNLLEDPRTKYTPKRRELAIDKNNVGLLLGDGADDRGLLPDSHPLRPVADAYQSFKQAHTLLTNYIGPLLLDPSKGCIPYPSHPTLGVAYPSWFPAPAHIKDEAGKTGGTAQCRFAAHRPAAQTFPPEIKPCQRSHYGNDGILASWDLSQIELRAAALMSGDPDMIDCYTRGIDLHTRTAQLIWPGLDPSSPLFSDRRHLAKQINFLTLYRGGPKALIDAARRTHGITLTEDFARTIIGTFWAHRPTLHAWQESLIEQASAQGYLELPTGWRRSFPKDAYLLESAYINEVCNFPVQALGSGQIPQSAQIEILRQRNTRRLPFLMPAQDHDGIVFDIHLSCWPEVSALITTVMQAPPLWTALCRLYHRDVPCAAERKILWSPPGVTP
jgi:uracil-DNA glycosylase family 4